jgi:hypothetical protein
MSRAARGNNKSAKKMAEQALSLARRLQAAQELKYVITPFERSEIINTGAVFFLNQTDQDIQDAGARIGDSIRCCRLRLCLQFVLPPSLNGSHSLRMAIIVDKQNTMANAGALYIGVGTNHSPLLQYTKDTRLQFAILLDTFPVNLDTYNPSVVIRRDMRINVDTRYVQQSSQINTGALKAIFVSSQPGTATAYPSVTGTIRVDYTDN